MSGESSKVKPVSSGVLRIPPLKEGDQLWEKYKRDSNIRYHMSQTDTKLFTHQVQLAIQETNVEPDSIQPSRSKLLLGSGQQHFQGDRGREPQYLFENEKLAMARDEEYFRRMAVSAKRIRWFKRITRQMKIDDHNDIMKYVGPEWYQELSNRQKSYVEQLEHDIQEDTKSKRISNTSLNLSRLGVEPLPEKFVLVKALQYCDGDAIEFLLAIFRMMNTDYVQNEQAKNDYTINDRIVLSSLCHLALESTLREMHIRIPSPLTKKNKPKGKKHKAAPKEPYDSPYLEPLVVKPRIKEMKPISVKTIPDSPYFHYKYELKRQQMKGNLPEKTVYKHKDKAPQLEKLVEYVRKRRVMSVTTIDEFAEEHSKSSIAQRSLRSNDSEGSQNVKKPKRKRKTTKMKRKREKSLKPFELPEPYTYYPIHDLDRQPTTEIIAGVKVTKDHQPLSIIAGISKMDYRPKRLYNYIIGGVIIRPDKTVIHIIQGIKYEPLTEYCTVIHGGIYCSEETGPLRVVAGISSKEKPDIPDPPPPGPQVVTKQPYCQCEQLYDEYIRLKTLQHEKCLNMFRQFALTKQKKALKDNPDITYVLGGVKETDHGPVYILSGVKERPDPWYEPVIGGVTQHEGEKEPTLIISGIQATRMYSEYMRAVMENLRTQPQTHYIINGVTTTPDGVTKCILSGVTIRTPTIKTVECHLEGVHYEEEDAVVVDDEGVTNPWLRPKYTAVISGVTSDDNDEPLHIVQGLSRTGYDEPSFTYVVGGVGGQTDTGQPLFIVSGVKKDGIEVEEEVFRPKCNYLIGGVRLLPDRRKVLIIQGIVIDRDEITKPCTYVVAGVTTLKTGETVPIIQAVTSKKPVDCECLDIYREYLALQEEKHKSCMELYRKYIKKREMEEAKALKERMNATFIIAGVQKTCSGDPRFIITGAAAKKIVQSYKKPPTMPVPTLPIMGGVRVMKLKKKDKYPITVPIIQGLTSHLAEPQPVVVIGGVKENRDGSPTYIISSVQVAPTAENTVCELKKRPQHLERETLMIVGGVRQQDDGTSTFIIDGVTTCDLWVDDEEDDLEPSICKCMRVYKRWLEIELKNYDNDHVIDKGRQVEDVLIPFIDELPEGKVRQPQTIEMVAMPKKYYKISCIYEKQIALLKKVLSGMTEDGYPLPSLPFSYLLPHFRVWMDMRCGKLLDEKIRKSTLMESRKLWNHVFHCPVSIPHPKFPYSDEEIRRMTYNKLESCKSTLLPLKHHCYRLIKQVFVNKTREMWGTTFWYDFPSSPFLDVFYAYGLSRENDITAFRPWQVHEQKNLGGLQNRCKVKPKPDA